MDPVGKKHTERLSSQDDQKKRTYASPSKSIIKWNAPKQAFLPNQWLGKFICRAGGSFATASANPVGFAGGSGNLYRLQINNANAPLGALTTTTSWGQAFTGQEYVGFEQLCNSTLYQNYIVYGYKIRLTLYPSNDDQVVTAMAPSINSTVPDNIDEAADITNGNWIVHDSNHTKAITKYICPYKVMGTDKKTYLTSDFGGTYAAAPVSLLYLHVIHKTTDSLVPAAAIPFRIQVTAYIKLWQNTQGVL